ncbi:ABC transporter permease [Saccharolobus solfataricus]|uniref:Dipeptide ABC transporter permease protein (DppC-3) n=3 Tax=Saccharolobus solfataricus TaxID=2287 RepID=Q97VK7_SACS2|nr:ABC transporter permease [Saccharolobus solfataricus]AAK42737.1 Dipeptide ABC transporter permease protein (dppC-3) [Saccharolobus solfataricus P2]AKA72834.1 ABC transporter permease [Saccharolobus solfataricus]AKA75533.1 ABC transporter permease [Saccharolobus solfataricus]AKA78226.1 ABC transporter permease [Saccharolobus solfataricus]AZF67344.1 ABC transporter permease [Saccharolobus solfataricus]
MSESSGIRFMLKALIRDKAGLLGLIIVSLFLIWSLIQGILEILSSYLRKQYLGYILLPHNPFQYNLQLAFHPPSSTFLLGTNAEGEDILSRILYALPRDAFVAIVVVFSAIIIGGILGILAGYLGGIVDEILMRVTDAFLSLPALILVIAITVPLKATFFATILGLAVVWWPTYARFYRAQTLRIKNMDYISAAKLSNVSRISLFYRYIFLNAIDPVLAYAALDFGNVILTYSTLAFLGIGITPPIPELGEMAANGVTGLPQYWWWALFPGLTILIIVVGFVLLGDRLQDVVAGRIVY